MTDRGDEAATSRRRIGFGIVSSSSSLSTDSVPEAASNDEYLFLLTPLVSALTYKLRDDRLLVPEATLEARELQSLPDIYSRASSLHYYVLYTL
jgi:hypothetical protein